MLSRKVLDLEIKSVFLDPEGRIVVLDVYTPTGTGQQDFVRRLAVFPTLFRSLELMDDWNAILDARID